MTESTSIEGRIVLAIQALEKREKLSVRRAAAIYDVPRTTLQYRYLGRPSRRDTTPNSRKMKKTEEEALLQYLLELDARGRPARLANVEDMANLLLAERDGGRVGMRWARNFISRQPLLRTRFNRPYDYQRALCEDPDAIRAWFRLVENMRAKYGVVDQDLYNFDETGFAMGMIHASVVVTRAERRAKAKTVQPGNREWATVIQGVCADGWCMPPFILLKGAVHLASWYSETDLPADWVIRTTPNGWTDNETGLEWIRHFDKHTAARRVGAWRMVVLDGHESHYSAEFERFCKDKNIIPLYMPPHSSHLLQPLDVGLFAPLKRAYGRQIEDLVKAGVNHVSKPEFLVAIKAAIPLAITSKNVLGGFRGAGLVPLDAQVVIDKLDVKLRTPSPTGPPLPANDSWTSQTPHTTTEATSQTELIKSRIISHQGSSPTSILGAIDQLAKGTQAVMHQVALLRDRASNIEKANAALSKRKRAKNSRLQHGGSLSIQDAQVLISQKGANVEQDDGDGEEGGQRKRAKRGPRHCGICGERGHDARNCQNDAEASDVSDSE
jgi:hypothetical protein